MRFFTRFLGSVLLLCLTLVLFTGTVKMLKGMWFGGSSGPHSSEIAVVELSGIILGASRFSRDLDDLLDDKTVKAIVIHINSPGGIVAPSQEIYQAIKRADEKVPVIISMESLAASGGYYAALGGRKIFADPGTLTASIGVIMEFVNTEKLYQWAKIERFNLKAGKFKDAGSPLRPMTPDEKKLFEQMALDIHAQFKAAVKERRHLKDEDLADTADGRVMTGAQAKAAKLIDELGGLPEAINEAKKIAKVPENTYVRYPESHEGFLRRLILGGDRDEDSKWEKLFESLLDKIPGTQAHSGWRLMLLAPIASY